MSWVFPRCGDGRGHVHSGGQAVRIVVGDDGGQHAGEFRGAGKGAFQVDVVQIAFRGHGIASFRR